MSPSLNMLEKGKKFLFEQSKDPAKMLLITAAFAWTTSAFAQIGGIISNDKMSKKDKEFLVPQEIADAAINIASFIVVTSVIQNFAKELVSKARIITPKIREVCEKYSISLLKDANENFPNIGNAITNKIRSYQSTLNVHSESDMFDLSTNEINLLNDKIKNLTEFKDDVYSPFENGLKVLGNIVGGVLSTNIITPFLRNPIAAFKQKSTLERDQMAHDAAMYRSGVSSKNKLTMDTYRVKVLSSNNGSMRI